ncbi:hypothetical protein Q7P37_005387 [Cladosporium fusiforme]
MHRETIEVMETSSGQQANTLPTPSAGSFEDRNTSLEDAFGFASFLWDPSDSIAINEPIMNNWSPEDFNLSSLSTASDSLALMPPIVQHETSSAQVVEQLLAQFGRSDAPPILASVEPSSRWTMMRNLIMTMTQSSPLVRSAVVTYSALQGANQHTLGSLSNDFYMQSQEYMTRSLACSPASESRDSSVAQHILTALFFLSYTDLLSNRSYSAHVNLKLAHDLVSSLDSAKVGSVEKRLISWTKLVDARAVSAGGDGLFLKDDSDAYEQSGTQTPEVDDAEGALSDLLSRPAMKFFQRTQAFMGRITRIDQWHRPRETVDDETEVMATAAKIRQDNHRLWAQRPPLIDLATEGKLGPPLIAENLSKAIVKCSRVAVANYHATFIHLHRVAHRHLPRTVEVVAAIGAIRQLAYDTVQTDRSLPVNMLWPMLMWGSEEDDHQQREWITTTIRSTVGTVSNANITAEVLEGLWKRQDSERGRVDIRTVMHDTFNSCFAIV